jgi:hypothetical protein
MSKLNVIPEKVMMGPMWQRLPYDLIVIIMRLMFLQERWTKPGLVIDKHRFDTLNHFKDGIEFRSFATGTSSISVLKYFYSSNDFAFKMLRYRDSFGQYGTKIPPALPPILARRFLRRIEVHLKFEPCYHSLAGDYNSFQSVEELFKYCPAASTLRDLTQANTGFRNLDRLVLRLDVDFKDARAAMSLFQEAEFTVRARAVAIIMDVSLYWSNMELACLIDLIKVVH